MYPPGRVVHHHPLAQAKVRFLETNQRSAARDTDSLTGNSVTIRTFRGTTLQPESLVAHQRPWPRDATSGPKARPRGQMDAGSGSLIRMLTGHFCWALILIPAAIACVALIRMLRSLPHCRVQESASKISYRGLIASWPDRVTGDTDCDVKTGYGELFKKGVTWVLK